MILVVSVYCTISISSKPREYSVFLLISLHWYYTPCNETYSSCQSSPTEVTFLNFSDSFIFSLPPIQSPGYLYDALYFLTSIALKRYVSSVTIIQNALQPSGASINLKFFEYSLHSWQSAIPCTISITFGTSVYTPRKQVITVPQFDFPSCKVAIVKSD